MISSLLVICVGNICRSPTAAKILQQSLMNINVESAGLSALVGRNASTKSQKIAVQNGINLDGHTARQFDNSLAAQFDLLLALESNHLENIFNIAPEARGKAMLLGHWENKKEIPDPYGKSIEFHASVFEQIHQSSISWINRLQTK